MMLVICDCCITKQSLSLDIYIYHEEINDLAESRVAFVARV